MCRIGDACKQRQTSACVVCNTVYSRMFHWQWQWQFIDSDNVVLDYYYVQCSVEINVINYMLWCLNYISSRLVFETWVLVLCPRGVSPSLITMLPRDRQCSSTWWLTKWLLLAQYLLLVALLRSFWHRTFAGWPLPSGTRRVVSSILAILGPSHDIFYCYDIPRYIVTCLLYTSDAADE